MQWDYSKGYEGKLLDLFECLYDNYYPKIEYIIETHQWLLDQVDKDILVLRHNKYVRDHFPNEIKSPSKPRAYKKEDRLIIASDNEPTACLYTLLLNGNTDFLQYGLKENLALNNIRIGIIRKSTPEKDRVIFKEIGIKGSGGMNSYPNRVSLFGLKLCHIHDANNCQLSDFWENIKFRMIISLSPLNIFPFPSHSSGNSKIKFKHFIDHDEINNESELGEQEIIQEHFLSFLESKFGEHSDHSRAVFSQYLNLIGKCKLSSHLMDKNVIIVPISLNAKPILLEKRLKASIEYSNKVETSSFDSIQNTTPSETYIDQQRCIAYRATRFNISERAYQLLISNPQASSLIIRVNGGEARKNHPTGIYRIPRDIAISFIESKREQNHWIKHNQFVSLSIPTPLKKYFHIN